jgi:hypothetical protein
VCIAGNGVFTWGPDLETAYLRLELVEHLARIALAALPLGGVALLPDAMVADLVSRRVKSGLAAPDEVPPTKAADTVARTVEPAPAGDAASRAAQRALAGLPGADPALVARLAAELAARSAPGSERRRRTDDPGRPSNFPHVTPSATRGSGNGKERKPRRFRRARMARTGRSSTPR